jgi:Fic/DOC family
MAPPLRMAVAHVQFEAIHPFSDGNGRVGRLLPPLMLAAVGLPRVYLAGYLKAKRRALHPPRRRSASGSVDGLASVLPGGHCRPRRDGAYDRRSPFKDSSGLGRQNRAFTCRRHGSPAARRFPGCPVQTVASARDALGVSPQAANTGIFALLELGILREMSGRKWGRSFQADEIIAALERVAEH